MYREMVRDFFLEFEIRSEATVREVTRQELIAEVREFVGRRKPAANFWEAIVSALDAELGERVRAKRIVRVSPGVYHLPSAAEPEVRDITRQDGPFAFSLRPPIDEERLRRLVPRELPPAAAQDRSARGLFSEGFGGLDARAFVATGLLALREDEFRSLFALQDFAL